MGFKFDIPLMYTASSQGEGKLLRFSVTREVQLTIVLSNTCSSSTQWLVANLSLKAKSRKIHTALDLVVSNDDELSFLLENEHEKQKYNTDRLLEHIVQKYQKQRNTFR